MKKIHKNRICKKCGEEVGIRVTYNSETDLLHVVCMSCTHFWKIDPLDKKADSENNLIEVYKTRLE